MAPRSRQIDDTQFEYPISYQETEPFSKPHTVTVLLGTLAFVVYALYSGDGDNGSSQATHVKRGMAAAICVGLVFCAEHLRDTLFVRPHPAIWRFVTGVGLFYVMALTFALFQPLGDLRDMMKALDPEHATGRHGAALGEISYAEDCTFSLGVMWGYLDRFVAAHFVGWIFKAFMFRHVGIAMVTSFLFEMMEYTFAYLQPNFAECWWDHWLLDFILCNTGGIIVGHLLMDYFEAPEYSWVGMQSIPTVGGKIQRLAHQFTPHHWTRFEWGMFGDFKRFLYVNAVVWGTLVIELDAFFLKYLLRIQPASSLNVYRLILWWAVGMVGLRDYYAFMTNPRIQRLGATMWIVLAMMLMEFIVVLRFGSEEWRDKIAPPEVKYSWTAFFIISGVATAWWFGYELPRRKALGEEITIGALLSSKMPALGGHGLGTGAGAGRTASAKKPASATPSSSPASVKRRASIVEAMTKLSSPVPAVSSSPSPARATTGTKAARVLAQLSIAGTPALGGLNARQGSDASPGSRSSAGRGRAGSANSRRGRR